MASRLMSDRYELSARNSQSNDIVSSDMVDRMLRLGIRAPILLVGGLLVSSLMEPGHATLEHTLVSIPTHPHLVITSALKCLPCACRREGWDACLIHGAGL